MPRHLTLAAVLGLRLAPIAQPSTRSLHLDAERDGADGMRVDSHDVGPTLPEPVGDGPGEPRGAPSAHGVAAPLAWDGGLARVLQKPFKGKSYIHENEFYLEQLWQPGTNKIVDWYYKGLTSFYFTMQELSRVEHDPFFVQVLEEIKAGKYVLKKAPQEFGELEKFKLVATVEGKSLQLRETSFNWEFEKKKQADYLFYNI
jgi:hypothetical protein